MLRFHGARVYTRAFDFQPLDLCVEGGRILGLLPPAAAPRPGEERVDARGLRLIPGLIDLHIHGARGRDTMEASPEALAEMSRFLAERGVTAFLPTTMSTPVAELEAVLRLSPELPGARMLGFNMEGPFLSPAKRGAHLAEQIRRPDIEEFRRYLKLAKVKLVTLAPEIDGAMDFIDAFHSDTVISLGHSAASCEVALEAIGRGARSLTHTFNAMPPLLHREPGLIGAAVRGGIYGEMICDGVHVHPAAVYCAYRMFGKERLILVSDAMRAAGLGDGPYELGGQTMRVEGGVARTADGRLAGSTSNIWAGLKNAVAFGLPLEDALRAVTCNPAALIGESHRKGRLDAGMDADFVLVTPELEIHSVYIAGRPYRREG